MPQKKNLPSQDASGNFKKKHVIILRIYTVDFNANFLPCSNGHIIWKIKDNVKKLDKHVHTKIEMFGSPITELIIHKQ
jgi:hypothetical protein